MPKLVYKGLRRSDCYKLCLFLIILLCSSINQLNSQTEINLKNLDAEIAHLSLEEKASIYLQCYEYFAQKDYERAYGYNEKAYNLLINSNFKLKLAICYYNFGYINRKQANYPEAIINLNNSINVFKELNNKIGLSECYNNIGSIYRYQNNLNKAIEFYTKAYNLAEEADYLKGIVDNTNNIGLIYSRLEHYDKAIYFFEKSLELQEKPDISVLNNLGAVYKDRKDNNKALEYYEMSLNEARKTENIQQQVAPLGNIGVIYLEEGKNDKALKYFNAAKKIEEKLNLKKDLIATYSNIGQIYRVENKTDSALIYFKKAMNLAKETSSKHSLVKIYTSLALTYEQSERYVEAIDYLYKINRLNKELFDIEKNAQLEEMLARYESDVKEKELALLKKDQALKNIELKNKQSELENQKLKRKYEIIESNNQLLLLERKNEVQALNLQKTKIEKEKKEKELNYITKEHELEKVRFEKEQSELKQKNLLKNIAIISAVFIILSAIAVIILYQQKLKATELLNLRNEEINKRNIKELINAHELESVKASIEGREKERRRIAQDLHDGIGGNLASIKLQLANLSTQNNERKLLEVVKNIDDTYNDVRTISHNLIPGKITNLAFTQLITSFANEILDNKKINLNLTTFPEEELNNLSNEIKIEIYRIIQELLNNIVKYSKANNVDIQLIKRDNIANLMIEDDGIGFDTEKQFFGIGLNNIKSRIENMNGNVSIESSIGNWSLVNIEIPVEEMYKNPALN